MNGSLITEDLIGSLERRFGKSSQPGRARVLVFGSSITCSLNYSKLLNGHKFFFAVPHDILDASKRFPETDHGEFVLLTCGSAERTLVLPRSLMIEMLKDVPTRRVDIFLENGSYVLQTTKHPKINVTEFLNAYPTAATVPPPAGALIDAAAPAKDRDHVKAQWGLVTLGRAEGCTVWVPVNDRNLSYQRNSFSDCTLSRLPNFGFDENTRRIVQNIDVLWLTKNVICKAFEIEATTSIYSGLLRMNDLVLAQPNIHIELYLVAAQSRRGKVRDQLCRPSFQSLAPKVLSLSFEEVDAQLKRIESLALKDGARVSGLLRGEKFELPEHAVYPTGV